MEVEDSVTAGDYLQAFMLGTREALSAQNRENITITVPDVSERSVGELIALFDRATGFYASFININAYHQPGVEAGKKAAAAILEAKRKVLSAMTSEPMTLEQIAERSKQDPEMVFKLLKHMLANPQNKVVLNADMYRLS